MTLCGPRGKALADWATGQAIETQGFKPARIEFIHTLNRSRTGYADSSAPAAATLYQNAAGI